MTVTYLYWIRYKHHIDPLTEGYIGITQNPEKRMKYHTNTSKDNPILNRAIKNGAEMVILACFHDRKSALSEEREYRPSERIGWNIINGGGDTPDQTGRKYNSPNHGMRGKKHSELTKEKMSNVRVGKLWWNNGIDQIRAKIPPEGYTKGRLPYTKYNLTEEGRLAMSKNGKMRGKRVRTPFGEYDSITDASEHTGLSWDQVKWRLDKEKYNDWSYID